MDEQVKKREDYHLQAAWLAIGAAALAMCWQCMTAGYMFERWRMWVFITLNLLLLAILFTSTADNQSGCGEKGQEEREKNKREKQELDQEISKGSKGDEKGEVAEREGVKASDLCLSKEELNERVEAFIAMFKQQLISDAKSRNRKNKII